MHASTCRQSTTLTAPESGHLPYAAQCEAQGKSPLLDERERLQARHSSFLDIVLPAVPVDYAQQRILFVRAQFG